MPRVTDSSFEDDSDDGEHVAEQVAEQVAVGHSEASRTTEKFPTKSELKKSTELYSGAFDAKITAVVDVDDFHCIVSAEKPVLDRIQQMLAQEVRKFDIMLNPIPGIECVVRKGPSDEWMRGVVRKIPRDPKATDAVFEVMAVDYGSIFSVPRHHIRRYVDDVKERFTEKPPLAIPCRLHGLTPRWTGNKTKDERQRELSHVLRFGEGASGPDVRMTFVKPATDGKETMFTPVSVYLPIDEKLESGPVSGILYGRGLALPASVNAQKEKQNDAEIA